MSIPDPLSNLAWEMVHDTAKWLHGRATHHIDTKVWPKAPPPPPALPAPPNLTAPPLPAPPALSPPPPLAPPLLAGAAVAGAGAATASRPETSPALAPPAATAADSGWSYSDQVAQGVACLACTRGHLATAQAAAQQAVQAVEAGDEAGARRAWATAAAELDALVAWDWHPDKLARTPAEDRAVVEAVRDCVTRARQQIPTPAALALAFGGAEENRRFASSTRFTERDAAEIELRARAVDLQGNYAERMLLADALDPDTQRAAVALREGRHVLDTASVGGQVYAVDTWTRARTHFGEAAALATPIPGAEAAHALLSQCQRCTEQFYGEYFDLLRRRRGASEEARPTP